MADHSKPTVTSTYANYTSELDGRLDDLALGLDPATTSPTNVPTNAIRWASASNKWQKWNGSAWGDLSSSYSINVNGTGTFTQANFADNAKAIFGAGSDLQIYHDGAKSVIEDQGTGNLVIRGSSQLILESSSGANYLLANDGSDVKLYYNTSVKFATTSTGIDVTGTVVADGLEVNGGTTNRVASFISTDASGLIEFADNATTNRPAIGAEGNDLALFTNGEKMRITSAGDVGINTSSPAAKLAVVGGTSNASNLSTAYSLAAFNIQPKSTSGYSLQFGSGPADLPYIQMSAGGAAAGNLLIQPYGGNVGIGVTSPLGRLSVDTGSTTAALFVQTGGTTASYSLAEFRTGTNLPALVIKGDGNAGIGTSAPTVRLHASGSSTYVAGIEGSSTGAFLGLRASGSSGSMADPTVAVGANADNLLFRAGGAERMRITSAGSVGIGTSAPGELLSLYKASGDPALRIQSSAGNCYVVNRAGTSAMDLLNSMNGPMTFSTNNAERMRIDSAGVFLVGKTADASAVNTKGINLRQTGQIIAHTGSATFAPFYACRDDNGDGLVFYRDGAIRGRVVINTSSVSYNTTSDYRLKENVVGLGNASSRVLQLNPVRFNFIGDSDTVDGFLAHEAQAVVPEAVSGEKDAVDAEGNPEYQGIDQSKLVPLLTAALQEALAQIESLTARVSVLEGN